MAPPGYELIVLLPLEFLPSKPPIDPFQAPAPAFDMAELTTNELTAVQQLVQLSGDADPKSPRNAASSSSSSSSVSPSTHEAVRIRSKDIDGVEAGRTARVRKRKYRSISRIYDATRPVTGFLNER